MTNLSQADFGLGVITDHSSIAPWVLFEAGYLDCKLKEFMLLTFDTDIPKNNPLSLYQSKDGAKFNHIIEVATKLVEDPRTKKLVSKEVESKKDAWVKIIKDSRLGWPPEVRTRISQGVRKILSSTISADKTVSTESNRCFQEIICKTVEDLGNILEKLGQGPVNEKQSIKLQRIHYPEFLLHLQDSSGLACRVKAVAVVDDVEEFWSEPLGRRIADKTKKESERLFVFKSRRGLEKHWRSVLYHAKDYNVYVTDFDNFSQISRPYNADFSIIIYNPIDNSTGSRVIAKYDDARWSIEFSTSKTEIARHGGVFERLLHNGSPRIDSKLASSADDYIEEQLSLVSSTLFPSKDEHPPLIQMSEEISPQDYDLYEEDHPYFREMMSQMLIEFNRRIESRTGLRILELGAGTGHFTKRIAQQPIAGLDITAVEYDERCFAVLRSKLLLHPEIKTELGDSVTYNPEGEFAFIFSSFAEHHISPDQKKDYLVNVKNNLEPNGRFIVGDEFLRSHNRDDNSEHFAALEAYHHHIIDVAKEQGYFGLAKLENEALECGKKRIVDFKMSIQDYENYLHKAGLLCEKKVLMSPEEKEHEIGGIYVLVIRRDDERMGKR